MKRYLEFLAVTGLIPFLLILGCGGSSKPPVYVTLWPGTVSLGAGEIQQFTPNVTGTSNAGVTWSVAGTGCTGDGCGTISSGGLYTAPSLIPKSATVSVTATSLADPKTSASATVTHVPLSVAVSPSETLNFGAGASQNFTASITKHSNQSVTWSLGGTGCAGDACGTLTNVTATSVTYNAPASVASAATVTVTATSVADNSKSKAVSINLMPISVSISPGAASVILASTWNFSATARYDPQNAGVTWALSGAGCSGNGCGTLTDVTGTTAVYHAPDTAPDPPMVTLTATSITDGSRGAAVTITIYATLPTVLQGKYAFLIHGRGGESGEEAIAGHLEADGAGKFTGVWDVKRGTSAGLMETITGSYGVQSDGQGTMTIQAGTATWTYNLTMDATGETARLAGNTFTPSAAGTPAPGPSPNMSSGYMAKQDPKYFALSSVEGDRVISLFGNNVAALGRFTSDAAGTLGNGVMDLTWSGGTLSFFNTTTLAGAFGAPDPSTGRGTASSLTVPPSSGAAARYSFAYYVVSDRAMLLVETDVGTAGVSPLSGEVRYQNGAGAFTNSSLNAPAIFHLTGQGDWWGGPTIGIGEMAPNSAGALNVIFDRNDGRVEGTTGQNNRAKITLNVTTTGSYSVSANGRVTLSIPGGALGSASSGKAIAYLLDQNTGYLGGDGVWGAAFGSFEPQTGEPFDTRSLAGTFLVNTDPATIPMPEYDSGSMTLGADGTVTGTVHINAGSGASTYNFTGSFTIASNGRGTMTLDPTPPSSAPWQVVFWAISPTRCVAIVTVNPEDTTPILLELRRRE